MAKHTEELDAVMDDLIGLDLDIVEEATPVKQLPDFLQEMKDVDEDFEKDVEDVEHFEHDTYELFPDQEEVLSQVKRILRRSRGYIDQTGTGDGKTYTTMSVAKAGKLDLFVVCPMTLEEQWKDYCERYGFRLTCISFDKLSGKGDKGVKHPYLKRIKEVKVSKSGKETKIISYEVQKAFKDLLSRGILLVIDECHFIKNNSLRFKAVHALFQELFATPHCKSRFALLSATILDKDEHALQFMRLIGYIKHPKLHSSDGRGGTKYLGIQELIDCCLKMDKEKTEAILEENPLTKESAKSLVFDLCCGVVGPTIGVKAIPPPCPYKSDRRNGFYNIRDEDKPKLADAVKLLSKAMGVEKDEEGNYHVVDEGDFANITVSLMMLELGKCYDIARVAKIMLKHRIKDDRFEKVNPKVIIGLNYKESIFKVKQYLKDYDCAILYGETPKNKRHTIIKRFNTDPTCRVMIMNNAVGGVGLSLHDTVGDSPRYTIVSPSTYNTTYLHQVAGRTMRRGVKSNSYVRIFYAKDNDELAVREAHNKKSRTLKKMHGKNTNNTELPSDYKTYVEA